MNYNRKEVTPNYTAYYLNDKLHRTDGPAVEWNSGNKSWWLHDKRHRLDGPAVEWYDGEKSWYISDKEYSERSFHYYINNLKIPEYFNEI